MTSPRIEIDLDLVGANARALVRRTTARGISVTGVTKALRGHPALGRVLLDAGAVALGDSRVENIERLRAGGIDAPIVLIRSPLPSEIERVVASADVSSATEVDIVRLLSAAAVRARRVHGIMLMVELGDLREGIMPAELPDVVARCLALPGIEIRGIGANLACRNGVVPDDRNMGELSDLAESVEDRFGLALDVVSGGNSANLAWADTTARVGRIDNLRLGESILLGVDPRDGSPIAGLRQDTATVTAEVIESQHKPRVAWGERARQQFPVGADPDADATHGWHSLLAIGHQDTDPLDLTAPAGLRITGASSDHLVVASAHRLELGAEIAFRPGYSALVRAMGSRSMTASVGTGPAPVDLPATRPRPTIDAGTVRPLRQTGRWLFLVDERSHDPSTLRTRRPVPGREVPSVPTRGAHHGRQVPQARQREEAVEVAQGEARREEREEGGEAVADRRPLTGRLRARRPAAP